MDATPAGLRSWDATDPGSSDSARLANERAIRLLTAKSPNTVISVTWLNNAGPILHIYAQKICHSECWLQVPCLHVPCAAALLAAGSYPER